MVAHAHGKVATPVTERATAGPAETVTPRPVELPRQAVVKKEGKPRVATEAAPVAPAGAAQPTSSVRVLEDSSRCVLGGRKGRVPLLPT